jgi:pyruvate formate lyase activating enzyme
MSGREAGRAALWFEQRDDGRIACLLCPHACVIADGRHGICKVRLNHGGAMEIPFYGMISSMAVDPIEKKPLYHYHPGARIFSVGFVGCSLRCGFCQNWQISQCTDARTRFVSPRSLVEAAQEAGSFGIAYTYSEPLIHAEYLLDAASLARAAGLKNVLVSNGLINPGPADEVLALMDAANIDLKSFSADVYRKELGGSLEDVKRFLSQAAARIHLEVTTLVVPGMNDTAVEIEEIATFIASLGADIPFHLSAYFPQYRYDTAPTQPESVRGLAEAARTHLHYVYCGNIGPEESTTACRACGSVLVRRVGYSVQAGGLRAGACAKCGAPSPIVVSALTLGSRP